METKRENWQWNTMRALPASHRILPHSVSLRIPGFDRQYLPGVKSLAPEPIDSGEWFNRFANRVLDSIGRAYLPVLRISDGEFEFLLGPQPLGSIWPRRERISRWLGAVARAVLRRGFSAGGVIASQALYSSGRYTSREWATARGRYSEMIAELTAHGVLAAHLTFDTPEPFQQHYFPAFGAWLRNKNVMLNKDNYVPFYFVYALLRGPLRRAVFSNRRALVVHSATGLRREAIVAALYREGVREVQWLPISAYRSLFDNLDLAGLPTVDLCLVGAGVGKPNVLLQLERLGVPAIDAGYCFEAWANPATASARPYMTPDDLTVRNVVLSHA